MTILHTRFLVHWTGRDFHDPPADPDNTARAHYVNRLRDILKNGFYMQPNKDKLE